jgi:hypothetical protein
MVYIWLILVNNHGEYMYIYIYVNMGNMPKTASNGLEFCSEYDPMFFMFQDMFLC